MTIQLQVRPNPFSLQNRLRECQLRVAGIVPAGELWRKVLSQSDREVLGNDFVAAYEEHRSATRMWQNLHGVSRTRAILDVARRLNLLSDPDHRSLLRETGEWSDDPDEMLELATQSVDLVLCARPRSVIWRRRMIDIDWIANNSLWSYFWELCLHRKRGSVFDNTAFADRYARSYLLKMKSRLSTTEGFPLDLADLIESAGRATQRLAVPPRQIRLFELDNIDTLREIL